MEALFICENLYEAIINKKIVHGRVHSVFKNACNIEAEHNFITLLTREKVMAPMSVMLDNEEQTDFKTLAVTQNSGFSFSRGCICSREMNIYIGLKNVQVWSPDIILKTSGSVETDIIKNVKALGKGIEKYGRLNGIGPLVAFLSEEIPELELFYSQGYVRDKSFEFIRSRFLNFIDSLLNGDIDGIDKAAEGIIGFGPGLTPSVDDFICGIMLSFIYLGGYYKLKLSDILDFNRRIIDKGLHKTTRVSSEMLLSCAEGRANQAVKELIQAILSQHNAEDIDNALIKTVGIGETSGSDTALGIYVGCKIMTNLNYRGDWVNEAMC